MTDAAMNGLGQSIWEETRDEDGRLTYLRLDGRLLGLTAWAAQVSGGWHLCFHERQAFIPGSPSEGEVKDALAGMLRAGVEEVIRLMPGTKWLERRPLL